MEYFEILSIVCDFKISPCSECCVLSFGRFPSVWILYADISENTLCYILIDSVSRKNNQDEIVGVFIRENFGSKIDWANRKEKEGGGAVSEYRNIIHCLFAGVEEPC